jgi:predicted FMN-binding regulatory protein PaiB
MILDETQGENGVLFGHLDADNPQSRFFDGRELLAVFQGPNAYISPHTYESDQLPTWNSIAVYARGRARVIENHDELIAGLQSIPTQVDRAPGAYRLPANERRIPALIGGIVGFVFEIEELEGRFKLSQDRTTVDQERAREVMNAAGRSYEDFVKWLHE